MNLQLFNHYIVLCLSILTLALTALGETPRDMDKVQLRSGTVVEGCLIVETNTIVTVETLGGSVSMPRQDVESIATARPGESSLLLGLQLLERRKLDRAERILKKASLFSEWRDAGKEALERLEQVKQERAQQQKEREQNEIENLIRRDGLQAGINELKRRYKDDDPDEYWGTVRGRLHLMMARNRIDHLDLSEAERHLAMAERYGVESEQWEAVRKELLETRRASVLLGPSELASRQFAGKKKEKKPQKSISSPFLAAVLKAQGKGEKIPPVEWLQVIDRCAQDNSLDPLLVWAIIDTESAWQANAVSPKGAQGLMQLMPTTAQELDVSNPFNPEENIRGGISYMRFLMEMFNDLDTALAAYNVGPGRVERTGIPPAGKRYIDKVRKRFASLQVRFGSAIASS